MTPSEFLYQAAGEPQIPGRELIEVDDNCYLCGQRMTTGSQTKEQFKRTWTAHDTANSPGSQFVCPACVWCLSEKATHPDEPKPFKMRTKTHLVIGNQWTVWGLGDKSAMTQLLLNPPAGQWMLAICDSPLSASHSVYRAPINTGGNWVVSLGSLWVAGNPSRLQSLLDPIGILYNAGHTKTQILSGDYNLNQINNQGQNEWASCEAAIGSYRNKPLFDLAVFLIQKEEENE